MEQSLHINSVQSRELSFIGSPIEQRSGEKERAVLNDLLQEISPFVFGVEDPEG